MKYHHYTGLTDAEVAKSRAEHGSNVLTPPAKTPLWLQFMEKFRDPLIIILLIAGFLSIGISVYEYFGLHEDSTVFFEPVGIFVAIIIATGIGFFFEWKADKEFTVLNKVNDDEPVTVVRNGDITKIARRDVVVGDIIVVEPGCEIPADGDLLESTNLNVDESTLTGEPMCHKSSDPADADPHATYPTHHLLRGTKVMEGHGVYRATAVGDSTENGKVFVAAQIDNSVRTPLNEQLDRLGMLVTKLSYSIAAAIIAARLLVYFHWVPLAWLLPLPIAAYFWFVIFRFNRYSWKINTAITILFTIIFIGAVLAVHHVVMPAESWPLLMAYTLQTLMIAVTLIVVAVPEGLPMAVTLSLAYSMRSMLRTNNLVRKMHACETMGATTVICTDKTGTLTRNQMRVGAMSDVGATKQDIYEAFALNSTAALDISQPDSPKVVGNPTEGALILYLRDEGIDYRQLREHAEVLSQLPFSTERKYMATLVRTEGSAKAVLYVKGAPEMVLALCSDLGGRKREDIDRELLSYQNRAMRTLAFACKEVDDMAIDGLITPDGVHASDLRFQCAVGIADPVRDDVPAAVGECLNAGIKVKIVTGDSPATAREIGRQTGLWKDADKERNIITGPEIGALSDEQLDERVEDLKIIARARPMDKRRLVESLQRRNEVVAVTGDGTNDAPALKAAHVGLSMGDGTSVAKEASDITIIDNSFSSIGRAVMWGRSLYQNIQRFLLFQLTVNVTACLIVLVGSFMGKQSPLTVTQMLWVNLIMDTFGAMALASLPPSRSVMAQKPRNRRAFIVNRPMAREIFGIGGLFFLILLAMLYVLEHADITSMAAFLSIPWSASETARKVTPYELTLFFSVFVWLHFWYMFNARAFESGRTAFHFRGCEGFGIITGVIVAGQILIVEVLYRFFEVVPMRLADWLIIVALTSVVVWVDTIGHCLQKFRNYRS